MSKKIKHASSVIRELFTSAFIKYHLNKMTVGEFMIRFLRIDLVSKGSTPEKEELLKILRNYQRGIKDCECPPKEKISFREFLKQRSEKSK